MSLQELLLGLRSTGVGGVSPAVIVMLAVVFLLVGAVLLTVYILRSTSAQGRVAMVLQNSAEAVGRKAPSWIVRIVALLIIVGTIAVATTYLNRTSTCLQCHDKKGAEAKALAKSTHKNVSCAECHQPPGASGAVRQVFNYGRWLQVYSATKQPPQTDGAPIEDGSCVRCHENVTTGVSVYNGIRVRHSDFIRTGMNCVECHGTVGHPGTGSNQATPTMDKCLPCHNGKTASYACETCHAKDVAANSDVSTFPKVANVVRDDSCYRCHEERKCTSCHGVVMPHPAGWAASIDGSNNGYPLHARQGFTSRQDCFRCHFAPGKPFEPDNNSCFCHGLFGQQHGGQAWVKEHGLQATGKKPGQFADCFSCHSYGFCSACHPPSFNDLYAPVVGNDSYVRDVPLPPSATDF